MQQIPHIHHCKGMDWQCYLGNMRCLWCLTPVPPPQEEPSLEGAEGHVCFTGTPCGPLLPLNKLRANGLLRQTRTSPTAQAHIATTPAHRRHLLCAL